MSLNRLINLARRTGDRLIVHQPENGNDVVIMDVDEYEFLLTDERDVRGLDERNVRGLTERQLLDQINRDIAIWRANDKLENEYEEDEEMENNFFSPLPEHQQETSGWHRAGSVLDDRFEGLSLDVDTEDDFNTQDYSEDLFDKDKKEQRPEIEDFGMGTAFPVDTESKKLVKEPTDELVTQIPYKENFGGNTENWHEEPLSDDEPVFYEEPV